MGSYKPNISGTSGQERSSGFVGIQYFNYSMIVTKYFNFLIWPKMRPNFKDDYNIKHEIETECLGQGHRLADQICPQS